MIVLAATALPTTGRPRFSTSIIKTSIFTQASPLLDNNNNQMNTESKDTQVHEFAPANTSCAVDGEAPVAPFQPSPMFAPGFAPYPYGMPMMMPPHMQGQQQQFQYPVCPFY